MTPKKFDKRASTIERRKRVIKRLQNQLLTGFKSVKLEGGEIASVKLTEGDIERINKEIATLETRLL